MSKIIYQNEVAEILTLLLTKPELLQVLSGDNERREFLADIGELLTRRFGGEMILSHQEYLCIQPDDDLTSLINNIYQTHDCWGFEEALNDADMPVPDETDTMLSRRTSWIALPVMDNLYRSDIDIHPIPCQLITLSKAEMVTLVDRQGDILSAPLNQHLIKECLAACLPLSQCLPLLPNDIALPCAIHQQTAPIEPRLFPDSLLQKISDAFDHQGASL